MNRILVTGATGRAGRHVVSQLLGLHCRVRAMTRRPESAGISPEAEVVAGDLTQPHTVDACLEGIDSVFLVWDAPIATVQAVLERIAKRDRRIVFLSSPYQIDHPLFQAAQPNPISALHAAIECQIKESGLAWTFLRPGMFSANVMYWWAEQIRAGDVLRWPYALSAAAPIDERDIAAVAVRALCEDRHAAADYVLTGGETLTHREQVSIIGDVLGRSLRYEEITPEEWCHELPSTVPPHIAKILLAAWEAAIGHPAYVSSSVAEVTGRPPRAFREWVTDHAADLQAGAR